MFLLLTSFVLSFNSQLPNLQREDVPEFQVNLLEDAYNETELDSRCNADITLNSKQYATTKRENLEFFACSLSITETTFTEMYAFGAGYSTGNGGAIFCFGTTLSITGKGKNQAFMKDCKAAVGGGISALYSNVFIEKAQFESNRGYKYAGAIYFQGNQKLNPINKYEITLKECNFHQNNGGDIGGAMTLTAAESFYMEQCTFYKNTAKLAGGACWVLNSNLKTFDCDFLLNNVGTGKENNDKYRFTNTFSGKNLMSDESYHFRGRGGGAIFFLARQYYNQQSGLEDSYILYSENTCYKGNIVYRGTNFHISDPNPGHHIMIDGFAKFTSNQNYYDPVMENKGYSKVSREWENATVIEMLTKPNEDATICEDSEGTPKDYPTPISVSYPSSSRSVEPKPNNPSPSAYTYVATPITRLPDPTTKSKVTFPTTKTYTHPSTRPTKDVPINSFTTPAQTANPFVTKSTYQFTETTTDSYTTISYSEHATNLKNTITVLYTQVTGYTQTVNDHTTTISTFTSYSPIVTSIGDEAVTKIFIPFKTSTNYKLTRNAIAIEFETSFYAPSWAISTAGSVPTPIKTNIRVPVFTEAAKCDSINQMFTLSKSTVMLTNANGQLKYTTTDHYMLDNKPQCNQNKYYTILKFDYLTTNTVIQSSSTVNTFTAVESVFSTGTIDSSTPTQQAPDLTTTQISTYSFTNSDTSIYVTSEFVDPKESHYMVTVVYTASLFNHYTISDNKAIMTYTKSSTFIETAIDLKKNAKTTVGVLSSTKTNVITVIKTKTDTFIGKYAEYKIAQTESSTASNYGKCLTEVMTTDANYNNYPANKEINTLSTIFTSTFTKILYKNNPIFTYTFTEAKTSTAIMTSIYYNTYLIATETECNNAAIATKTTTSTITYDVKDIILHLTPDPTKALYTFTETMTLSEIYTDTDAPSFTSKHSCYSKAEKFVPSLLTVFDYTFTQNGATRTYMKTNFMTIGISDIKTDTCLDVPIITYVSGSTYAVSSSIVMGTRYTKTQIANYTATNTFSPLQSACAYHTLSNAVQVDLDLKSPLYSFYTNVFVRTSTFNSGTWITNTFAWSPSISFSVATENKQTNIVTATICVAGEVPVEKPVQSTMTIIIGDIPDPTPRPTAPPTPAQSPLPTASRKPGQKPSKIVTTFVTGAVTETIIYTTSYTKISTENDGTGTWIQTATEIATSAQTTIWTYIVGESEVFGIGEGEVIPVKNNKSIIIAAVVSALVAIAIIALLVWFFVGYSKSSSSSDSVVEMDEETVLHVPDSTSAPITNDNPLWTTSVMGDTDDPFRNDFEEVAAQGFFNERAETVDSDP